MAPGFEKYPSHILKISNLTGKVQVSINGAIIGSTTSAVILEESNYPAVYYLPVETLDSASLRQSDHTTYCPFKGTAEYLHLIHNDVVIENAIWIYREPYAEALPIKDLISIYSNVGTFIRIE